jgi:SAM-dependent methyltransferase
MDRHQTNKKAWEEAFDHRREGWCDDLPARLKTDDLPYLNPMLKDALKSLDLRGKTIAQFCCNNGRELLSAMQLGAKAGYGFDIAENMIAFARDVVKQAGLPCVFTATDILSIGKEYNEAFDLVFFTIGAITWFEDLAALFRVASRCLKPGGVLLINDYHPFVGMLPIPGEEGYDENDLRRLAYSYFRKEPWLEQNAAGYMAAHENSHTFASFSHTMADILNAAVASGLAIAGLQEYDVGVGVGDSYNDMGFPLSFTLRAVKS